MLIIFRLINILFILLVFILKFLFFVSKISTKIIYYYNNFNNEDNYIFVFVYIYLEYFLY